MVIPTSTMPKTETRITPVKKWLETIIISHTLCPFAKREFERERIHYSVIEADDLQSQLQRVIAECAALDKAPNIETSLLIFPNGLSDFDDYLDALSLANALLEAQGYSGIYQLASFHPDYIFEGVPADDPSHYTNRSPFPLIHILREASVERVLKTYPNPENIPERNIKAMRALGLEGIQELFDACYK